jgi:hypothetical protein
MRHGNVVMLTIVACGLFASACDSSETSKPAPTPTPTPTPTTQSSPESPATPVSQPASQAAAAGENMNAEVVQWRLYCDLDDGRRFLSDGSLLVEARYFPNVPIPEKSLPATAPKRLLQSPTDRQFGLADLQQKTAGGHYTGPGVQLNRKYVELLRGSPLKETLRFRAKGANDPVLIVDGQTVVGVVMPIKS